MNMRRLTGAVAVVSTAALLVSGCGSSGSGTGGGDATSDAAGSSTSTAPTGGSGSAGDNAASGSGSGQGSQGATPTVSVWIQNGAAATAIQDYLAKWGPKHHIDVKVTVQASDQYGQALTLALKTGKGPDVFGAVKTPQLVEANYLLPLNGRLSDKTKAQHSDALKSPSPFIIDGKKYAVPTTANTRRLAYNKDIFTKAGLDPADPPTTFSQIEADCKAIAKVQGVYCFGLPLKWTGFVGWDLEPLAVAGSSTIDNNAFYNRDAGKFDFGGAAPVIKLYRDMIQNKWAYPGASSLDNDPMRSAFAQGKIAMFVSASWDIGLINDKFQTKADWAGAPLPVPDGQTLTQSLMNAGTAYAVNAKAADPDAAVSVLEAMAGADLGQKLASGGLLISVNQAVEVDPSSSDLPSQFVDYAPGDLDVQQTPNPTKIVKITGDTYNQVITALILGSGDIDSALTDLTAKYQKALDAGVSAGDIDLGDYR